MNPSRTWTGIALVTYAAFLGLLLVFVPPMIVENYEAVSKAGGPWVYLYFGAVTAGAAILLVVSALTMFKLWSRSHRKALRKHERNQSPSQLTPAQQDTEINENLQQVHELAANATQSADWQGELSPLVDRLEEKRESQNLEIVAFGSISSGKSSVLNLLAGREVFKTDARGGTTTQRNEIPWPTQDKVTLVDTPGLGEIEGEAHIHVAANAAKDADLVLVVVDGPLREHEFQLIAILTQMEKRFFVVVNKADWFREDDRKKLMNQISQQIGSSVVAEDIVAVRAQPAESIRVRILPDGRTEEEKIQLEPDITALASRMMAVVESSGQTLLMANMLMQSRGLVDQAKQRAKDAIEARAWQIVERHMWSAGGAAAISPLPLIDLAAGCAISTKMVIDLAHVYGQQIDLEIATNLLGQLGKNLISILGTSIATPAIAAGVASLLKTVPGAGTIAGGLLQGIVQALVTRWIGAIFIEWFSKEMNEPEGGLAGIARRQWEKMTTPQELRKLVVAARAHLKDSGDQ